MIMVEVTMVGVTVVWMTRVGMTMVIAELLGSSSEGG
jgi:hypothetical protein